MSLTPPDIPAEVLRRRELLVEIYITTQKRLTKQLTGAALTDFARFRINEQLTQLNAIIAALNVDVRDAMPGVVAGYYKHGADLAGIALEAQGVSVGVLNLGNRINTAAIQVVAEQMALDFAKANASMKDTGSRILRETQQTLIQEKQINQIIADGLVTGETRRETSERLRKAINDKVGDGKMVQAGGKTFTPEYYAELVTRTRTREAVTQGAVTRSMEYGITLFQVSIHDAPCAQCAQYQGKVYSVVPDSGFPMLEARPPFHPHCVLPETAVFAPGQRAASIATYNGPIVDLRLSNSAFVSVTPNHMFLTPTGFAFAKDLCEGDDVLCSALFDDVVLRDPNNHNRPSIISDVVESLAKTRGMSTTGVPVSPEYLHGDARFMNGNIDIIRPDCLLGGGDESEIAEYFRHLDFSRSDVGLFGLSGCRDTIKALRALSRATNGVMGLTRERQAALWAEIRHANNHSLASRSFLDPAFPENAVDNDLRTIESLDKIANALSGGIARTNLFGGQDTSGARALFDGSNPKRATQCIESDTEFAKNIGYRSAGPVRIASIVLKGFREYSGHVYDLQTESSLYICNSMISSNCRHVMLPYVVIPGREEKHATLKALSNTPGPISGDTPGFEYSMEQARKTGGLRKKQIQGEVKTITPPVPTGPTGNLFGSELPR